MKTPTIFKVLEVTNEKNGYNMPIVKIESSTNLDVINRGWNVFECLQDIDISDLEKLDTQFKDHSHLHLDITTPIRQTCCWYYIKSTHKEAKHKLQW